MQASEKKAKEACTDINAFLKPSSTDYSGPEMKKAINTLKKMIQTNLEKEVSKLSYEINQNQTAVEQMAEDIEEDNKMFEEMAVLRKKRIDKIGCNRLKQKIYNTNGSTREEFSIYDPAEGAAARNIGYSQAMVECAVKSKDYNKML